MKILHIGLLSHYTENMTYQDNIIPDINCKDGHQVIFISDNNCFNKDKLIEVSEEDKILDNNLRLVRVKYDKIINSFISSKIQKVKKLKELINEIEPDCILYHGVCGYELTTVAEYKKQNSKVKFYVDSHEDFNNTAKTKLAKIAYKYIHGFFVNRALPYIDKLLYITEETKDYLIKMYRIEEKKLEWFPLGGIILSKEKLREYRNEIFNQLNLPENSIIFAHSGKLVKEKKTKELINAFSKINNPEFRLLIFGSIPKEEEEELERLIDNDSRIMFLGWKNDQQIYKLLAATDMYCQPGTQSATLQNAICGECALMIYPHKSYKNYISNNGFFVSGVLEMVKVFERISKEPNLLFSMKRESYYMAEKYFDYYKISSRLYI